MELNLAELKEYKETLTKANRFEIICLIQNVIIQGVSPEYEKNLMQIISAIQNLK